MMASVSVNLLKLPTSLGHATAQIRGGRVAFPATFGTSKFRISCVAKPATVEKVCEIVRKQLALPADQELTPESEFSKLGADSLDTVEIVMGLEEEFNITVEEDGSQNITTVQEAADLIENILENKAAA